MGVPDIVIAFQEAARTALARSARGVVAVILDDGTGGESAKPVTLLKRMADASSTEFTSANLDYLRLAFEGGPSRLLVVRLQKDAEGADDLDGTLELLRPLVWNWMCMPGAQAADVTKIVAWIKAQRAAGKTFKAVLPDAANAASEGIVNFTQTGIKAVQPGVSSPKAYTTAEYCCRIAGMLAGMPLTRSSTYFVLDDVLSITSSADADQDVDDGKLILLYDGEKHKIARGVTSLTGSNAIEDFKKIKMVEGADMIAGDIRRTFADNYVGQVVNDYDHKQLLVANINRYLSSLEGTVLDSGYDNRAQVNLEAQRNYLMEQGIDTDVMSDAGILSANTGAQVFLSMQIQLLDAMEDLKLDITLE